MSEQATLKPQILVIDDSKVMRRAALKMLGNDYLVHEAEDGVDGWAQLQRNDAISVVFSDMQMPRMNGLELLAHIRGSDDDHLASLPVIMITGVEDTEAAKRDVFEAGATDFIAKPFDSIDLLSRARSYAHMNRKVEELEKKTAHDQLTGLFNAASFQEQGEKALSFAIRHQLQLSVVFLEIIGFQDIYLKHGKKLAQRMIAAVGQHLQKGMRIEDVAARVGVARYAVLFPMTSESKARVAIARIRESVSRLVLNSRDEKIEVALAAGYTSANMAKRQPFAEIMEQAGAALHAALESSQADNVCSYIDHEQALIKSPAITEADLRRAFGYVFDGSYDKVPDHMLQAVADKLAPFLDYVAGRPDTDRTGTDNR